jgi:Na+/H+ antiporter NhaC
MSNIEFNPATLVLLAILGGIFGAVSTVATYAAFRVAREVGEELAPEEARIKLPIPGSDRR